MENIRKRQNAKKSYIKCMIEIKIVKAKFNEIIHFLNKNKEINKQLTTKIKTHLNHLKDLWDNTDDANIENFFKMKEHHSYINGNIENETLNKLWIDYLKSGLELRNELLCLNMLCNDLTTINSGTPI